jgi:tetratricopeptide (TPR) repeat protein
MAQHKINHKASPPSVLLSKFFLEVYKRINAILKFFSVFTAIVSIVIGFAEVQREDSDAEDYVTLGLAYAEKGQYDRAIENFSKAVEIDSNNASVYSNRGDAYYYKGQYDHAISDCSRAIEINPKYAFTTTLKP